MPPSYVTWALLGMVSYSFTTLFMKLAVRDGRLSSFLVVAMATLATALISALIVLVRGDLRHMTAQDFYSPSAFWAYGTALGLAIAVNAFFRGLGLGPASVVVPIYCLFSAGGALLGLIFLHEPLTTRKLVGIALAAVSVFLIAGNAPR